MFRHFLLLTRVLWSGYRSFAQSQPDTLSAKVDKLFSEWCRSPWIRHLIHHTRGLRNQWALPVMASWGMSDVIPQEHIFNLVRRQQELNCTPGAEPLYCNTGYTLLTGIVTRVGKQPFRNWMQPTVFSPLNMKNTLFYTDDERIVKGRAYSFHKSFEPGVGFYKKSVLSYSNAGTTSLFTAVTDLASLDYQFQNAYRRECRHDAPKATARPIDQRRFRSLRLCTGTRYPQTASQLRPQWGQRRLSVKYHLFPKRRLWVHCIEQPGRRAKGTLACMVAAPVAWTTVGSRSGVTQFRVVWRIGYQR